jgi:hypothetical protein
MQVYTNRRGIEMTQRGAPAALRGYRLQALYTLKRIFAPGVDPNQAFCPEGIEDLDLQNADRQVVEALQVKSYASLTLSDLEPGRPNSFFHRAVDLLSGANPPSIKIVNFGEIGPQMTNAWKGKEPQRGTIAKKLKKKGFQETEIEKFFEYIELVSLDEESEHQKVLDQLQDYPTGIDTQHAFDLFVAWYYRRAEKRQSVTSAELRAQINKVGKFLAERYQYHQHWHTTIAPLESIPISDEKRVILRDEFYAGVHTRFEHILAELDFLREHKTNEITQEFQKSNVVIVHAASGQGKSTLAYRYVHEWYPDKWRFAIKRVQDVTQALGIARALSGFAEAIQVPIAVCLDVYPRDTEWPELVRQLAQHPYLEVLVTIREEDYRRASIADAGFEYGEVELEFNQQEAQLIYERARSVEKQWNFLDFDDAWDTFGGDGPLMEFVYLLTQTQTLPERLQGQVARIEKEVRMGSSPDELRLLQLVPVASAYGARLCTRELLSTLNLPAANRTLTQFEKEYLLRRSEDGFYLEGLHPVRSQILSSLLIQPDITPWLEIAAQAMPLMPEEDLETFILHAFVEQPEEYKNLLEQVKMLTPHSWPGIAGLLRCLLWAGVKDYITENDAIIEEAYEVLGPAWWFTLDLNFSLEYEALKLGEWWTSLGDLIPQEKQDHIKAIRQSQSPKENVFRYATQWLETLDQRPTDTISPHAWRDVAEVWYWGTRLVRQRSIIDWVSDEALDKAPQVLPLPSLADLSLSLYLSCSERHSRWLDKHIATLHRRLAHEHNILALEEIGTTLKIHFIPSGEAPADAKDSLHEETMLKIKLIRKLIPTYEQYSSQGYGFKLAGIELPQGDSTHKKGIPSTHLPPLWPIWLNGIASGLARYRYRPATWDEYLDTIIEIRRLIVDCLKQLNRGLIKFCQRDRPLNVGSKYVDLEDWQRCRDMLISAHQLPASAVDPWGFAAESTTTSSLQPSAQQDYVPSAIALQRYRTYLKAQREYFSSLSNFISQAPDVWIVNANAGKLHPNDPHKTAILRELEKHDVKTDPHLSVLNLFDAKSRLSAYQREFATLFDESVDKVKLDALITHKREVFTEAWTRWYFYAYEPWKSAANPKRQVLHWMSSAKRGLRGQIDQALTSIQTPEFNAIRLDFAEEWQGEPAIWLRFNFTDPTELYKKMIEEFPRALRRAWGKVDLRDPMQYLIQDICIYIVIIPVVHGKMLDEWIRPFYTSTVLQTEDLTEKPWSHFPMSLPEPIRETLSIPIWDAPEIMAANQLSDSVATLQQLTFQISEFQAMPDLTESGGERLQTYIEKEISPLLSDALQTFFDTASELLNRFNALSEAEQERREKLTTAIQALLEVHSQVYPAEGDGVFKLNIDELAAYSQRLQQVYTTIEGIRLFWIADILDHMTY